MKIARERVAMVKGIRLTPSKRTKGFSKASSKELVGSGERNRMSVDRSRLFGEKSRNIGEE